VSGSWWKKERASSSGELTQTRTRWTFGPDSIEIVMRERIRETIERLVAEELDAARGASKSERGGTQPNGLPARHTGANAADEPGADDGRDAAGPGGRRRGPAAGLAQPNPRPWCPRGRPRSPAARPSAPSPSPPPPRCPRGRERGRRMCDGRSLFQVRPRRNFHHVPGH
jgi:hypothetical protein